MGTGKQRVDLLIKLAPAGLLVLTIGIVVLLEPDLIPALWKLALSGDVEEIVEFLQPFGLWAMLISFVVNVLINALGFLPSIFISTANGVLFGIGPGILISWLAECTGVIIGFLLMRGVLRHSAEQMISKSPYLKKVDEFSSHNGFKLMLFARALPYFPSGVISAVGAVSSISVKDYVLATLLGKFPSTALEVVIGHDLVNYEQNMVRLTVVVLLVIVIYLAIWKFDRRKKRGPNLPQEY